MSDGMFIKSPLLVEVVIRHAVTGEPLYQLEPISVAPGDTASWTYPSEGLKVIVSGA